MKSESIAFAIAGVLFGLLAGWVIGSQQATTQRATTAAVVVGSIAVLVVDFFLTKLMVAL